jgi:branched-chain amino acid transport system substrate-binding protein
MRITRRKALQSVVGAGIGASLGPLARPALAANKPIRIGLLTVLTGPLAEGGIQIRAGTELFLKQRNHTLAGRKVELIIQDTGGNPAGAKTKAQELVERDHVDMIFGPYAAFELLAINSYLIQHKMPTLSLAAADDLTSRTPNPYLVRASATSSQAMYPLADYAARELKVKTVDTIADDFAFGYEEVGGFQQVFDDDGGTIRKKLWSPLHTPDYTPYIAQIGAVDGVVIGLAGSNPVKFLQQYASLGMAGKHKLLGGETAADDALLKSFGDEAVGFISACPYSASYAGAQNKDFVAAYTKQTGAVPGLNAATFYLNGMVTEAALHATGGKTDDRAALVKAMRATSFTDSIRGPFHFDRFGNVVGNVFMRRIDKSGSGLVNTIIKVYPNVSQFWTFDVKKYLATPNYTRNGAPAKLAQNAAGAE